MPQSSLTPVLVHSVRCARLRSLVVAGLLGFATFVGFLYGAKHIAHGARNGGLVVHPDALVLGELWAQDGFEWTLRIENPTRSDVLVADFKSSCPCTTVTPRAFTVPGGSEIDVTVTMNLAGVNPPVGGRAERTFSVTLMPVLDGSAAIPSPWRLTGKIKSAFSLSSSHIAYAGIDEIVVGTQPIAQTVTITPHVPIDELEAVCDAALGIASIGTNEDKSTACSLRFVPAKDLPIGPFEGVILINSVLSDAEPLRPTAIKVSGFVVADVYASPGQVQFGSVRVGAAARQTVLVQSRVGNPFDVVAAESDSGDITLTRQSKSNGVCGCAFQVEATCKSPGRFSHNINFTIGSAQGKSKTICIPVAFYGVR